MKGFTLVELIITFAIAAILLTLAMPQYQKFVIDSRSQSAGTNLVAALRLARSEAITRGTNITVCPLNSAQNACSTSIDWEYGWRVWNPSTGEVIQDYPMNLPNYINFCCDPSTPLQYTSYGAPVGLTCSCPSPSGTMLYFLINPPQCTNVYNVQVTAIGHPSLITGAACP